MKQHKLADKFFRKAEQDWIVLGKLYPDTQVSDEIVGFHAQQAAEKLLKAVLAYHGIDFLLTHRLADLIDQLRAHPTIQLPETIDELRFLTPFAVEYRYDDFFTEEDEPFDRPASYQLVTHIREWVLEVLKRPHF